MTNTYNMNLLTNGLFGSGVICSTYFAFIPLENLNEVIYTAVLVVTLLIGLKKLLEKKKDK